MGQDLGVTPSHSWRMWPSRSKGIPSAQADGGVIMPEGRNKRPQEGGTPPGIASDRKQDTRRLPKCPTGIRGLDEITGGGLPKGRPTLVCGGAGCGKTLLAMEFLVRGVMQFDEPGVFMAFEETAEELTQNVRSLGFDLDDLVDRKKIAGGLRPRRAQRDRGDRRIRPGRAVHPPGLRHRLRRRQARRAGHDRDALRRPVQRPRSCGPSCAACSAGSRTRA